jgi:hypothetical protein
MRALAVVLTIFASLSAAASPICDYLLGGANPGIVRFGGQGPRSAVQDMANLLLKYVPKTAANEVQVGIPIFLESTLAQGEQFSDGQRNALATYGPLKSAPFVAVLTRATGPSDTSDLDLILGDGMPGKDQIKALEVSVAGQTSVLPINSSGMFHLTVDLVQLKWNQLFGAKPVFFRPVGWNDWFSVQFPYAYVTTEALLGGMNPAMQKLPTGQSVIDPLKLKDSADIQNDLRNLNEANNLGFILAPRTQRSTRVHGSYLLPDGSRILTATGGVWTRYRIGDPYKNVYLAKDPRVVDIEEEEGVVSGTGPHFIGATGEIIVNSLGQESLMTFYGTPTPTETPGGLRAYGFTHQWIGTWLRPGYAFVTPQGMYHWHLNHLTSPIGAQVFTPPQVPSEGNYFGFPGR